MVSRFVLSAATLALVSACAAPTVQSPSPEPPASKAPEVLEEAQSQGGASSSLLEQARQARGAGDFDKAEGLLLRAQRLDPRNGEVYLELALLYAATGAEQESRNVAERGLLYCDGATCEQLRKAL